jgi:hypothetical protein
MSKCKKMKRKDITPRFQHSYTELMFENSFPVPIVRYILYDEILYFFTYLRQCKASFHLMLFLSLSVYAGVFLQKSSVKILFVFQSYWGLPH